MNQKFERVSRHLYQRRYRTAAGDWSSLYYARFVCRLKKKCRVIPLGSEESAAKDKLKKLAAQDVDCHDFDLDRERMPVAKERDGKSEPFTFAEWADKYPTFDDVKRKRSLSTDLLLIKLHLKPFFGRMLLTEIAREALTRYVDARLAKTLIRGKKGESKKAVSRGTVSNELSLFRRMLRVALREEYKVIVPSFEGLIVRTERGGRALTEDEEKKLLAVYPPWMQRLAEFADETCLSQGDLLRVTEDMIDANTGIIRLNSGRGKTGVEQIPPLTSRCRQILDEIEADREQSKVRNVHGLVFTNPNGSPITKGQIQYQIEKAVKLAGIRKFVFHNYRNTALTRWAREGINVDVAMKASGHSSVQMHKRYVDLQETDIAAAFGTSQIATGIVTEERVANRK